MNAKSPFNGILAAIFGLTLMGLTSPTHADETKVPIFPHGTAVVNNAKADLEAGFEVKPVKRLRLRLLGISPLTNAEKDPPMVQFDKSTNTWRLATLLQYEVDMTEAEGPSHRLRFGLTGDWGIKDYSYYPNLNDGKDKKTEAKQSFSVGLNVAWYHSAGKFHGFQIMPQLFGRYDRSWKSEDKTGVVVPGETGQPSTVDNRIVKAPSVSPLTTVRLAVPFYPGWNAPLAFGPSVAYGLSSKKEEGFGTDLQRMRAEFWSYIFPTGKADSTDSLNVRIGLSPFWDVRTKGDDKREKHEYGLLVQLRVGFTALEY